MGKHKGLYGFRLGFVHVLPLQFGDAACHLLPELPVGISRLETLERLARPRSSPQVIPLHFFDDMYEPCITVSGRTGKTWAKHVATRVLAITQPRIVVRIFAPVLIDSVLNMSLRQVRSQL